MQLDHVALTVSDRERSAGFYATHFGLSERVYEDPHLLILASPAGGLLALSEGEVPRLPRTSHFGFRASSREDVIAVRERLRAAGVTETEWQDDAITTRVQVEDPDGQLVEIYVM